MQISFQIFKKKLFRFLKLLNFTTTDDVIYKRPIISQQKLHCQNNIFPSEHLSVLGDTSH